MKCPACQSALHRVLNTHEGDDAIRRRRECDRCRFRWSTVERDEAPAREPLPEADMTGTQSMAWLRDNMLRFLYPLDHIRANLQRYDRHWDTRPDAQQRDPHWDAPQFGGVYLLAERGEVVYVGVSGNIWRRLGEHRDLCVITFDHFFAIEAPKEHREAIEGFYLLWLEPRMNMKTAPVHYGLADLVPEAITGELWPT